jgi:hypothetical protein
MQEKKSASQSSIFDEKGDIEDDQSSIKCSFYAKFADQP